LGRTLRVRFAVITTLFLILLLTFIGTAFAEGENGGDVVNDVIYEETEQIYVKGKVLEVKQLEDSNSDNLMIPKSLDTKVKVTEGKFKDKILKVRHDFSGNPAYDFEIKKNDKVVLLLNVKDDKLVQGYIANLDREVYLIYLTIFFLGSILIIGRFKGFKAIITLVITVWAVLKVLLPGILAGYDPVLATILVSGGVTAITLLLVGGFNMKSVAAIVGTMGGIIFAGILANIVIDLASLSGLGSEEAAMLLYIPQKTKFDFQGLLFAGMIIGALGAIMDVGMSISSAIWEIHKANPSLTWWELSKSGLNVGKDIIGTMSNTLVLAYTGGSLPLLLVLMAYDDPLVKIINLDMIATEIVRALAGSIGLILAVPLTALCAGYLVKLKFNPKKTDDKVNL